MEPLDYEEIGERVKTADLCYIETGVDGKILKVNNRSYYDVLLTYCDDQSAWFYTRILTKTIVVDKRKYQEITGRGEISVKEIQFQFPGEISFDKACLNFKSVIDTKFKDSKDIYEIESTYDSDTIKFQCPIQEILDKIVLIGKPTPEGINKIHRYFDLTTDFTVTMQQNWILKFSNKGIYQKL